MEPTLGNLSYYWLTTATRGMGEVATLKFVSALGSGVANQVKALAVSSGGTLYAAGNCITARGELTA
jgi:hypothetical protein